MQATEGDASGILSSALQDLIVNALILLACTKSECCALRSVPRKQRPHQTNNKSITIITLVNFSSDSVKQGYGGEGVVFSPSVYHLHISFRHELLQENFYWYQVWDCFRSDRDLCTPSWVTWGGKMCCEQGSMLPSLAIDYHRTTSGSSWVLGRVF